MSRSQILHGECRDIMSIIPDASVDAIVTDPPYGLKFMGRDWDRGVPGEAYWREALRVAKPGAHLLAFGGTRTFHRLAIAIEDAGWDIRDTIMWVYGSGFPKSHDVGKAIDREAGAEREVMGSKFGSPGYSMTDGKGGLYGGGFGANGTGEGECRITAPATEAARTWAGWGTALKPAWEPILVARKPLVGTVAANVIEHGTGGINIDACRVGGKPSPSISRRESASKSGKCGADMHSSHRVKNGLPAFNKDVDQYVQGNPGEALGRWPANLIHDGSPEVLAGFPTSNTRDGCRTETPSMGYHGRGKGAPATRHGDSGSAARFFRQCPPDPNPEPINVDPFFYCPKASKADRGEGNNHPTVKPHTLMRYLCRLVTPPDGLILDPFMGSGSTGKAALAEGFRFLGIDQDEASVAIARRRLA